MPAGPASANQVPASYPGTPDSAIVGSSGRRAMRLGVAAAIRRSLPARRVRLDEQRRDHHHLDLSGEEIGHRRPRAFVGNVHDVDAEQLLQVVDADVPRGPGANEP